jgi:hypothetical protein
MSPDSEPLAQKSTDTPFFRKKDEPMVVYVKGIL